MPRSPVLDLTVDAVVHGVPPSLRRWWGDARPELREILYRPDRVGVPGLSLDAALRELNGSATPAPYGLVPVTFVDDWSLACLTLVDNPKQGWRAGQVVRWHLDAVDGRFQAALLDTDIEAYLPSLVEELGPAWTKGYDGMKRLSESYFTEFVEAQITPKAHHLRPFQLACQNVIIGLAAFRRDVRIDGQAVPYWLTCEAPHVATYEGARALSAVLLCDAFQSGGTMEISFSQHAERRVPASLRRYGRTLGIALGRDLPGGQSISPVEARQLFWAVTTMPHDLRERCRRLVEAGVVSVERLCYTLLSAVWSAPALDFLAACASGDRLVSVLEGGAHVLDRPSRAVEMELARAAVLLETFVQRTDAKDAASSGHGECQEVRLFEDTTNGIAWRVVGDVAAVEVTGLPAGRVPWHPTLVSDGRLVVVPRPHPITADFDLAARLASSDLAAGAPVAILTAAGSAAADRGSVAVLRCPVRLVEIDLQIERSLLSSTLGRS